MGASSALHTHLQSTKAPWVSLLVTEPGQRAESMIKTPAGFDSTVLRGSKCRTAADLFAEFARALDFPDYFGHNWDALEECLADLEWRPAKGYVLVLTEADQILNQAEEEDWATFVEVLSDAAEAWGSGQAGMGARRATPFHVLCAVSKSRKSSRPHWGITEFSGNPSEKPNTRSTSKSKAERRSSGENR